jgi:peroxiredoxin
MLIASLGLTGCDGMTDDLLPSGDDKRPDVEAGTIGTQVGQLAPDFSLFDTLGNSRGLYNELSNSTGVVLYFTMWCPICETHMSNLRTEVIPNFPTVKFFLVDYVMGTIEYSRAAQEAYGYTDIETLVDTDQQVFNLYQASMGTTVVIDSAGNIVRMNEDYKDGVKLIETLQALP